MTILGGGISTCRSSGFASSRSNSCRLNAGDRCSKHDEIYPGVSSPGIIAVEGGMGPHEVNILLGRVRFRFQTFYLCAGAADDQQCHENNWQECWMEFVKKVHAHNLSLPPSFCFTITLRPLKIQICPALAVNQFFFKKAKADIQGIAAPVVNLIV